MNEVEKMETKHARICKDSHPNCVCMTCSKDNEEKFCCCSEHRVWCADTTCPDFEKESELIPNE